MKKIQASALLFDMDGTLVDSTAIVESAWAFWSQRYNLDLSEVLRYSHGRPTLATMEHFGNRIDPAKDWQAEADEMQQREANTRGTTAILGANEVLNQLDPTRWAVVTSATRQLAEMRIQEAGLPLPRVLVPADEISNGKPHPEGYLKAASLLGFAPEECVVFEDTPPGVDAAIDAGMQVIGMLTTVSADRLRTSNLIRDYRSLQIRATDGIFQIELPD